MKRKFIVISLILFGSFHTLFSKEVFKNLKPSSSLLRERWHANWISCPDVSLTDYGVYLFRKKIKINEIPDSFIINISADNRYRLFVNEIPVCWGPARGDNAHWYFETINIASLLKQGQNQIAVEVWNFGPFKPGAQTSIKTGLIIQGNTEKEEEINTNSSWKVIKNNAYRPSTEFMKDVGCGDIVNAKLYPWGWQELSYNDQNWSNAVQFGKGQPYGTGTGYDWVLYPRDIPLMEESLQRLGKVRRTNNITVSETFLKERSNLVIAPNTKISFLIDQEYLTTAYPEVIVSGGNESEIKLTYCEALVDINYLKGNRDEIEGKIVEGYSDIFIIDGGDFRLFRPLWFRTYRYIQVDVETKDEPLTLHDIYGKYVGYPFYENASFKSSDNSLEKIWEVGWRTARLCAHETYYDCPYYEQLQYVGDTRIQALISLYVDGDDRLMRKAIKMFNWSRSYEGITTSRYPAHVPQYIPPFSLYWINMVHDYWMHREDTGFINEMLPGVKTILEWFINKIDQETGMLGPLPHWNFVDWPPEWPWNNNKPLGGVPPSAIEGGSAILSLQLAYTLKDAIELMAEFEDKELADEYSSVYKDLKQSVMNNCWDNERKLLADDIKQTSYSQHVNIMGILSDAVPSKHQKELFNQIKDDESLIQATFYYRFYLVRALNKVGLSNEFLNMLQPWYKMLQIGLTTFAENPEPTRSDCHAWSSSPLYDFFATVVGITPASPGFKTINIEPNFGHLNFIDCSFPHPQGPVKIHLMKIGENGIKGRISMPDTLSGFFIWKNQILKVRGGEEINISIIE